MLRFLLQAVWLDGSLVLATFVILPRPPARSGNGSVFCGDIAGCAGSTVCRVLFGTTASTGFLDEELSIFNFQAALTEEEWLEAFPSEGKAGRWI